MAAERPIVRTARGDESGDAAPLRVPAPLDLFPCEFRGKVVHDPQTSLAVFLNLMPEGALDLVRLQTLHCHSYSHGEAANLVPAQGFASLVIQPALRVIVAVGVKPEDATRVGPAETDGVLPGQEALAIASHTAHLRGRLAEHTRDNAHPVGGKLSVQIPHLAHPADKPRRAHWSHAVVGGRDRLCGVRQCFLETAYVSAYLFGQCGEARGVPRPQPIDCCSQRSLGTCSNVVSGLITSTRS
jgi:hypothetical protein